MNDSSGMATIKGFEKLIEVISAVIIAKLLANVLEVLRVNILKNLG